MSTRWPGGIINQTAPVPSGSFASSAASGLWTLEQQAYWKQQGNWPIPGNFVPNIEDVFSTYLYTGTGTPQSIVNGINLGGGYVGGGTGGSGSLFPIDSYAQLSTGATMNFGTGNWTIEFYFQGNPFNYGVIFEIFANGGASQLIAIQRFGTGQDAIYVELGSIMITTSGPTPWDGAWHHHAIVRNGGTVTYYIDGVSRGTFSTSLNLTGTNTVRIGNYSQSAVYGLRGYLSNLRVVSGTAVYTSNFTPPSSALTAISGTQLLCMQGATPFVDNSPNAFTINTFSGATSSTLGPYPFTFVAGKGGLVWAKSRSNAYDNNLVDTVRGNTKLLFSNTTGPNYTSSDSLTSFNNNGFTLGADTASGGFNNSNFTYCTWTFREQPKFFDIVTYTGNSTARTIAHNLGSAPGMIIIKCTTQVTDWQVYHRSIGASSRLVLNANLEAINIGAACWNSTDPTSTVFSLGTNSNLNTSGQTYVAYLFAHNAGGFGASGNENVISCGTFTTTAGGAIPTVTLGYEPQYLMFKCSSAAGNWNIIDNMRSFSQTKTLELFPNSGTVETDFGIVAKPTATGFTSGEEVLAGSATFIYMAIRRGPMKVPTLGTSVFSPIISSGSTGTVLTTGFPVDLQMLADRDGFNEGTNVVDRLRGVSTTTTNSGNRLLTASTAAENSSFLPSRNWNNTGFAMPSSWGGGRTVFWNFGRAPGFFDVVCYTGTGTQTAFNHNLTVAPELAIIKRRDAVSTQGWATGTNFTSTSFLNLLLNTTAAGTTFNYADVTLWKAAPTSTTFTVGTFVGVNASGGTYVAYLFATLAGVSKVGSYTGNGSTQTIACGFTDGARFVLIKRTDSTGDWYVYDTARGMVVNTDPYLVLNTTAAEVATNNSVITTPGGFSLTTSFGDTNASGGTYIFLAIA